MTLLLPEKHPRFDGSRSSGLRRFIQWADGQLELLGIRAGRQNTIFREQQTQIGGIENSGEITTEAERTASRVARPGSL
jgi:hypothetical protein